MATSYYCYKYNKYRNKYTNAKGGNKGPYTEACSRNSTKLNNEGLTKYLHYKKGSCQDLDWDINSCDKTDDPEEIEELMDQYGQCAEDRISFSEDCVISIDENHQHAIDRMKSYQQECKDKLQKCN